MYNIDYYELQLEFTNNHSTTLTHFNTLIKNRLGTICTYLNLNIIEKSLII